MPSGAVRRPTKVLRQDFYFNARNRKTPMDQSSFFDSLDYYIDDIDAFTLEEQYRLLYDLPNGRFVAL
ncbi:hypothetical protein J4E91_005771 [Alternaria rosae]|nr:hypothetical protein J4E91_005771 [Alternaria rosae]